MKPSSRTPATLVDNKKTVRAFVAAINAKDWSALRQLVAPAFKRHSVAAGSPGVNSFDDLVRFLEQEYATFPDACEWIEDILAEGSKVAVRHRFRGTQTGHMGSLPPSGRVLDATYLAIYRLERGVIVEAWAEWDNMAGLKLLGHDGATEPNGVRRMSAIRSPDREPGGRSKDAS